MQLINEAAVDQHSYAVEFKLEGKEWEEAVANAFNALASSLKIQGFRSGKIPPELIKKNISEQDVFARAAQKILRNFFTDEQFWHNKEYKKITAKIIDGSPEIKVIKLDNNEFNFQAQFKLRPVVELPNLKKLDLQYEKIKVSSEEVENEIHRYLEKDTLLVPKADQVVKKGDSVNINFIGKIDDKPFNGGTANDYDLIIGSNAFIAGFEDQLIGLKANESKQINVTFPNDYHEKSLAGKPVVFDVYINRVCDIKYPELNAEYLSKFKIDAKNEKEFYKYVEKQIYEWKEFNQFTDLKKQITDKLSNLTTVDYIPDELVQHEQRRLHDELINEANKDHLTVQKEISKKGFSSDEQYDVYEKEKARKNIVFALAIDKVIDEYGIEVTEKDLDEYFEKASKVYGISVEQLKEHYRDNIRSIESFIVHDKAIKKIISLN
ncbi:MAG: trigger factor [Mycoplasmataceae bacterium]|nr:trigger factor [Mycoplasmataceae bacterium]